MSTRSRKMLMMALSVKKNPPQMKQIDRDINEFSHIVDGSKYETTNGTLKEMQEKAIDGKLINGI